MSRESARSATRAALAALAVLGVAAAAALFWFLGDRGATQPPGTGPSTSAAPRPEAADGAAEGDGRARAPEPAPPADAPPDPATSGPRLRVVVRDRMHAPVPGATVEVRARELETTLTEFRDGVAVLAPVASGACEVVARAPGRVRATADVQVAEEGDTEVVLVLEPGAAVEGRVIADGDGSPVAGARVGAIEGGSSGGRISVTFGPPLAAAETGADGKFRIDGLPAGGFTTLTASHPRHASAAVTVVAGGVSGPVTLRLAAAGLVSGRVVDRDGAPVGGARVYLVPGDAPMLLDNPGGWVSSSDVGTRTALRAVADDDGSFTVESVPLDETGWLLAQAEGHATSEPIAGVGVTLERRTAWHEVVLRRPGALELTIRTDEGAPVEDADVEARLHFQRRTGKTDASGRLLLDGLDLGAYVVTISKPGLPGVKRAYDVEEGKTVVVELRLAQPCAIEGLVVDDRGETVPGMRVRAFRPTWESAFEGLPECEAEGVSDERGRFRVEGLLPGPYLLWAQPSGRPKRGELSGVTAPATGLRLVAARLGRLRFTLTVPDGVTPPEVVTVHLDSLVHSVPWKSGPLEVRDLVPGSGTATFRIAGFVGFERGVSIPPGEATDLGALPLDPGHPLEGRVVDPAGAAVEGAEVSAGDSFTPTFQQVLTDADGRFRLEHMAADANDVRIGKDGFLPQWVETGAGPGVAPLQVVLRRGGLLRLTVRAPDGSTVADAFVHVVDPVAKEKDEDMDDREDWERTDARGVAECRLLPGRYRVDVVWKVVGRTDTTTSLEVELTEGTTTEAAADLPR